MQRENVSNDHDLRIQVDRDGYPLSEAEWQKMERDLHTLRKQIDTFPRSELKVEISHQSTGTVRVAVTLLIGRTLFVSDTYRHLHPAWENCVRRLMHKVQAYKERLSRKPSYSKQAEGTQQSVEAAANPQLEPILKAIEEMDYVAFRQAMGPFEEAIERRVGRWVQRYPDAEVLLENGEFTIGDLTEEVFLNAFERFPVRPPTPMTEWLEDLIDESIRIVLDNPEDERENVRAAAAAVAAGVTAASAKRPPTPR